jgi:hypothetical protein
MPSKNGSAGTIALSEIWPVPGIVPRSTVCEVAMSISSVPPNCGASRP